MMGRRMRSTHRWMPLRGQNSRMGSICGSSTRSRRHSTTAVTSPTATRVLFYGDEASGTTVTVSDLSWADHQWGDFVISGTGGWDWFSIQLENNAELMLYVLRDRAGAASALFGSFIMP